ncbi:MAG: Stk1 family PASTA domain-containing Ser/Thr kinase, partial [Candidatus Nanopelagicales bacterium]
MDTTLTDAPVGRLLDGRYRVVSRLARGGMATVYQAMDTRLERTVAVKVMHPMLAEDPEFVGRFVREARSAARLSHPNVVGVYDQGEDDKLVYLVMEYVDGQTVRDLLRERGPLSAVDALDVVEPMLAALGAAHAAGLIHRDVKPENILVSRAGTVKVADFGLARAAAASTVSQATHGVLIGTVAYLSPEQVESGVADARSDVYAAGIVLYELLTGGPPFRGETPLSIAYRHVNEDVPAPSRLVPGLPPVMDALVRAATNRDPELRPADANRLLTLARRARAALGGGEISNNGAAELNGASDHQTLVVPLPQLSMTAATSVAAKADVPAKKVKPPKPERDPATKAKRRKRRRWIVGFLAVLIACVGVGYGAWWLGSGRYTEVPSVLLKNAATAESLLTDASLDVDYADPAYSETVAKDLVLSSDPEPTSRIREGSDVTLVMSLGPERYAVPDLSGMTVDAANAALSALTLKAVTVTEDWSEDVPQGQIISQSVAAGTEVKRETTVDYVVSKGIPPSVVPNVAGKAFKDAKAELENAKLKAERLEAEEFNREVPKGAVIRQSVAPGTEVARGTTVQLLISAGPPLVAVPDVTDKKIGEAEQILK